MQTCIFDISDMQISDIIFTSIYANYDLLNLLDKSENIRNY